MEGAWSGRTGTGGVDTVDCWGAAGGVCGGGLRLWMWARSGDWMLALELRFARPSLFLKRALKELMND